MAQPISTEPLLIRMGQGSREIDPALPIWARRSNPIVRRQLGIYWKTLPLDIVTWLKIIGIEAALVALTIPIPFIYSLIMPVVTVSVILVPLIFLLYANVLFRVLTESASSILQEKQSNTLALLMVTPVPFSHILFSKIAASVWRQVDNLTIVIGGHTLLSLPIIVLQYSSMFALEHSGVLMAVVIVLGMLSYFFRLLLEPIMLGALGILFGAMVSPRILALIVAVCVSCAYFAFVNLARLLSLPLGLQLIVELALPLVLPLVISWGALVVASYTLRRD